MLTLNRLLYKVRSYPFKSSALMYTLKDFRLLQAACLQAPNRIASAALVSQQRHTFQTRMLTDPGVPAEPLPY